MLRVRSREARQQHALDVRAPVAVGVFEVPDVRRVGHQDASLPAHDAVRQPEPVREHRAAIRPAVEKAAGLPGDRVENAVRINVENVVRQLRGSRPVLEEMNAAGHLRIVGAVYSLDTGKVEWLSEAGGR